MLRLEHHGIPLSCEPLHRGLTVDHRGHDLSRACGLLLANQHEVSVHDVRTDQALAAPPQREDIAAALRLEPFWTERDALLTVLDGENRCSGGDPAKHGNLVACRSLARPPSRQD